MVDNTPCPTCHRKPSVHETALRKRLAMIGDDWTVVRTAASRWMMKENRRRYPQFEWRHTRETLTGGAHGYWTVEARRAR